MSKENGLTLDSMRNSRNVSEVVFKKFTEANKYFETHAFCFYEGEDGKYYDSRVTKYWGRNFISLVAGNKREVLKIMKKIKSDSLYDNVCTMFFVDRDFDKSLAGADDDLFETPCYSVENFYAQEIVFARILQSEFGLSVMEADYHKCLECYKKRFEEFVKVIIKFNAIIKYQHLYKPEVRCQFSSIKTSHLACIEIEKVIKASRHDEQIEKCNTWVKADTSILDEIENEFHSDDNLYINLRGKNQLDFFVAFIKILKDLNSAGSYFSEKLRNVHINLTDNRLSELSQYAITPKELVVFLERHRPLVSS